MDSSVSLPKISAKFERNHPNAGDKYRWGRFKSATFDKLAITQKRYKINLFYIKVEYKVAGTLSNGDIAGDLE